MIRRASSPKRQAWTAGVSCAALLIGIVGESAAVGTKFFRTEGYRAFKRCTLEGVELHHDGRVSSGLEAIALGDPGARTIWSLGVADGKIVFSTGDQGKVFRIDDDVPEVLATLYNYELFAMTTDDDVVYAAGAPAGTVVRIDSDGTTKTIFTAPEGLIFDLLAGEDGTVFAASGERGRLYRIPTDGETDVVADSGDMHLRCLAWSADRKKIWAGTDGRGLLLRFDPKSGERTVFYDTEEGEVVEVLPLADGSVLFAANPGPEQGNGGGEELSATIYRMSPEGSVQVVWRCPERTIHGVIRDDDGSILAATGQAGSLYRISPQGEETLLWRADEDQVLGLVRHDGALYAATGNPGRVYRIGPSPAPSANLLSEILDAKDQATWGKLSWQAEGDRDGVAFETRSGFTSLPDQTWSEWTPVPNEPRGGKVQSPPGRYLQWRSTLSAKGKERSYLRSLRIAYIVSNRPPEFVSLSISPDEPEYRSMGPNGVSQTLPSGVQIDYSLNPMRGNTLPPDGVPTWVNQLRAITWDANDPDRDDLVYTLEIRQLGEENYRVLEKDYYEPAYTMETGILPDGVYEVRVTASDSPSNVPGQEQFAVRVTPPFHVDNAPPTVIDLKTRRLEGALQISGHATDADSPLRELSVSIDGGPFRRLLPADGIMDGLEESFEAQIPLERETQGNWVVVQVRDAAGNRGSFRAWLEP